MMLSSNTKSMKPNISKKEIESGQEIIDILSRSNPKLSPHHLKEIVSEYKKFTPHPEKYGLWSSKKSKIKKDETYDKIFLLISGIAASGKDAIREEMIRLMPDLFHTAVTGTSRPPRAGEIHEKDYYFFDGPKNFKTAVKNNELVEWVQEGERFYGLPKKSLENALQKPAKIICSQLEISAWSKMDRHLSTITETKIKTIKIFVLPHMNFSDYQNWLSQKRTDDVDARLLRTGWEIKKAAKKADFIISNRIDENSKSLTYTAQSIINQLLDFLPNTSIPKFNLPFEIKQELSDIESILTFHDSIK